MKNIILIAPPAAGKGTVSQVLKEKYGYMHISAGDLLRDEVKSGSEFGNEIKEIMARGDLVDNTMLKKLMKQKLESFPKDKPFVLDGYPRQLIQEKDYEDITKELGIDYGKAYLLDIDEQTAMERTLGRLNCPVCKVSYNKYTLGHQPKEEGICDICHNPLEMRTDDTEETFKTRFQTYMKETEPLIDLYKGKNNLTIIDAARTTEEVVNDVVLTLGE